MRSGSGSVEGRHGGQSGYAMVALLVALNVMAVMMTVALPVWRQMAQREKEAELIFRGQQYQRAIALFQRRNGPGTLPPDLDVLIEGRFLRKAYTDPITGEDFVLIRQGQAAGGGAPGQTSVAQGGIVGVVSRSEAPSIRVYEGQTVYNQWLFVFLQADAPGGGGRGGRGQANGAAGGGRGRGGRGEPATSRGGRGDAGSGRGQPTDGRGAPGGGRGGRGLP